MGARYPLRNVACGSLLVGLIAMVGCYNYDYTPKSEAEITGDLASPVSTRMDGDWALFPDGSAVAAVQRFYHDRFDVKVPTPSGTNDGTCDAGEACQIWINDIPSGNHWQQIPFSSDRQPAMYDLIVFAATDTIKSHIAVVDHVEKGTIFVMSSDARGDLRRAALPHGWKVKALGWFHLKKLDASTGTPTDRPPGSPPPNNNGGGESTNPPVETVPDAGADAGGTGGTPTTPTGCVLNAYYCGGHKVAGQANQLYRCTGDVPKLVSRCANGCLVKPDGQDDECAAPTPCVVGGDYCGGDKVNGDPDVLYNCDTPQTASVIRRCERGCRVSPPGQDDLCN